LRPVDFDVTRIIPDESKNRANAAKTLILKHWKSSRMDFVVERLSHHFERARIKLRQFVEEQHAAKRERDLTGAAPASAADQARMRNRVVRETDDAAPAANQSAVCRSRNRRASPPTILRARARAGSKASNARGGSCPRRVDPSSIRCGLLLDDDGQGEGAHSARVVHRVAQAQLERTTRHAKRLAADDYISAWTKTLSRRSRARCARKKELRCPISEKVKPQELTRLLGLFW